MTVRLVENWNKLRNGGTNYVKWDPCTDIFQKQVRQY